MNGSLEKAASLAPVSTAADLQASARFRHGIRAAVRTNAVRVLSWTRRRPPGTRFVRFPVYHHVFDDERARFEAHLLFYRNYGEFIGLDDALKCLEAPGRPDGAYYCLTFDDGLKSGFTNAVPLLLDHGASAAFFLPTDYIDGTRGHGTPRYWLDVRDDRRLEFVDWDDCRSMAAAGMTIGSHTRSHAHLADLDDAAIERELRESKEAVERELGVPCRHFCCPWGLPVVDYDPARDPEIARRLGYRSFLTGIRGTNAGKPNPFAITRDALAPDAGLHELRYVFWR